MPEGDTIYRAARTLHTALAGQVVTRFETGLAQLANLDRDEPIAGRTVEHVAAAGKHLLMTLSGGLVLRTHMRMNGSWHIYRPGERVFLGGAVRTFAADSGYRTPAGDSARWTIRYANGEQGPEVVWSHVGALDDFGALADSFAIDRGARLALQLRDHSQRSSQVES